MKSTADLALCDDAATLLASWRDPATASAALGGFAAMHAASIWAIADSMMAGPPGAAFDRHLVARTPRGSLAIHRWPTGIDTAAARRLAIHNHVMPAVSLILSGDIRHLRFGQLDFASAVNAWQRRATCERGTPAEERFTRGDVYQLTTDDFHHAWAEAGTEPTYTLFWAGPPALIANAHVAWADGAVHLRVPRVLAGEVQRLRLAGNALPFLRRREEIVANVDVVDLF